MARSMWCPKCGAEYRPGFTTCADCRVSLIDDPPAPAPHPERRFVELARVPALQARMIVNSLRASGAPTADLGAEPIYGSFNFAEGVPIYVAEDELALARQVLSELAKSNSADQRPQAGSRPTVSRRHEGPWWTELATAGSSVAIRSMTAQNSAARG